MVEYTSLTAGRSAMAWATSGIRAGSQEIMTMDVIMVPTLDE